MIYLVLGMHKSGTTLVASLLHHAGVNMVDRVQADSYEAGGYYERQSTYMLNLRMLGLETDRILFFKAPSSIEISESQEQQLIHVIDDLTQRELNWGFKDPRTCLTYPIWAQALPEHKLIVVFRSVNQIWRQYQYKGLRFWNNIHNAIALVVRWCEYNQHILDIINKTPYDYLVLNYDQLLASQQEYQSLSDFMGVALVDVRVPNKRQANAISNLIMTVAKWVVRLTRSYNYDDILNQLEQARGEYRRKCNL